MVKFYRNYGILDLYEDYSECDMTLRRFYCLHESNQDTLRSKKKVLLYSKIKYSLN